MSEKNETMQEAKTAQRRQFVGEVVSDKMDKTIVVAVQRRLRHKLYDKLYFRTRKFHVHDPNNTYKIGDTVTFEECRPLSKKKKWRVTGSATSSKNA